MASSDDTATVGTVNTAPMEARMRLGLYRSVSGSQIRTASALAASALLSTAPRLPGFSTLSSTMISGFSGSCKSLSPSVLYSTSARMPSVLSRYATFR